MKPAPFAYKKARSLEEAVALLGRAQGRPPARRRAEPDRHAQYAAVGAQPADRHQRHQRPRRHRPQKRQGRDRRAGPPCAGRALRADRQTRAADRTRHAAYRPRRHPQPRHARRLHRLRRSGGGIAGLPAGARRRGRCDRPQGQAHHQGAGFLQGPVRDRAGAAGRAHRHSRSGRRQRHARRLCRTGAPARRLRHCRPRGQRARRR